jgi:hypothetical protein
LCFEERRGEERRGEEHTINICCISLGKLKELEK